MGLLTNRSWVQFLNEILPSYPGARYFNIQTNEKYEWGMSLWTGTSAKKIKKRIMISYGSCRIEQHHRIPFCNNGCFVVHMCSFHYFAHLSCFSGTGTLRKRAWHYAFSILCILFKSLFGVLWYPRLHTMILRPLPTVWNLNDSSVILCRGYQIADRQ